MPHYVSQSLCQRFNLYLYSRCKFKPDKILYYGATQTMPFARPSFAELIKAVEFSITKNYPARGEYTSDL